MPAAQASDFDALTKILHHRRSETLVEDSIPPVNANEQWFQP